MFYLERPTMLDRVSKLPRPLRPPVPTRVSSGIGVYP